MSEYQTSRFQHNDLLELRNRNPGFAAPDPHNLFPVQVGVNKELASNLTEINFQLFFQELDEQRDNLRVRISELNSVDECVFVARIFA